MRVFPLTAALVLALLPPAAAAGDAATPQAMAAYAEQLLDGQRIAADGPGVTVLVARGEQLLYKGARGMASVELGVPLQPDQLMRIGSVTKQFAAAALLRLIDDGKARLDDPLAKYLPDYPDAARITLLQLLNHTSGIKSYTDLPGYMHNPVRRDLDTAALVREFSAQPVDFPPGQRWAYNNSGYVLVGAVIEAIARRPWHQQVAESLLQPAGIAAGVHYQDPGRLFKGMAQGYTLNERREVAPAGLLSMTQPHAAGALIANTEALWRWNQVLHGGRLLSAASYAAMTTPVGAAALQHYGLGIGTGLLRGRPMLSHGGGIHGFASMLNYLPGSQTTVVILRNSDAPGFAMDTVARKLAAYAIGEPYAEAQPVAVPAEALRQAEGVYARDDGTRRTLRLGKDGVLTSQRAGGSVLPLTPLGSDRYAFQGELAELRLERAPEGRVVALQLLPAGEPEEAERWVRQGDVPAEPAWMPLDTAQQQALVGAYSSPQFSIQVYVDAQGVLRGQAPGQPAFELKASAPRVLLVPQVDARLEFAPLEGAVRSVTLVQGPVRMSMQRVDPK